MHLVYVNKGQQSVLNFLPLTVLHIYGMLKINHYTAVYIHLYYMGVITLSYISHFKISFNGVLHLRI